MIRQQPPPQSPASAEQWDERWRVAGICLVLAAMTLAVFGQAIGFSFVNYDDDIYVYDNVPVAGGLSLKGLAWVFTHTDCNLYHPLTMLSLMADYQLHGLHASGFHLTNVVLHTGSVILLFLVLRQMTGALWRSAFVAAVFAIHPLRAESVAWVAERKDVLGTFFFMVTLGAYSHFVRNPKSLARYLMVAAAFVLALLSKPTVVTLPFVLLLLDYWPLRRVESAGKLVMEKIPLLALAVGACALTVLAAGEGIAARANVSLPARLGNAAVSYVVYLRQMVWPEGLAAFYPLPEQGHPILTITLCVLLLAMITGVILVLQRKHRWLLTGWLWYLGMLTPMIGLVQAGAFAHADRMTYLPQIGLYLLLTWAVAGMCADWHYQRMALSGLSAIILVGLFFCSRAQTAYWRNNETLWSHALACTTDNAVADNNLGFAFLKKGKLDEAASLFQKALLINPEYIDAHNNLGSSLFQKGRVEEAIAQYQMAIKISPDNPVAHYNLGVALDQKSKGNEAIAEYQKALALNPNYVEAQVNIGFVFLERGSLDEAITNFQKALLIKPDHANAHDDLGIALFRKGKVDEAIAQYHKALQSEPDNISVHNNLGTVLLKMGKIDEAIAHYQKALEINPAHADAHYGLGNAFYQNGKMADAIAEYEKALKIDPANLKIQNNLAWLLATCQEASLRNGKRALQLALQANERAGGKNPITLHTLAAAFAETGEFNDAIRNVEKAIEVAPAAGRQDLLEEFNDELKRYKAGLPTRQ